MKKRYMAFSLTVVLGLMGLFLILALLLPLFSLDELPVKLSKLRRPSNTWSLNWAS